MKTNQHDESLVSNETAQRMVAGFVARILNDLVEIFPASRNRTPDEQKRWMKVWTRALAQGGVVSPEIAQLGLDRAGLYPSLHMISPGLFVQWCTEELIKKMGIPEQDEIFKALVSYQSENFTRVNKFAWWCIRNIDMYRFKKATTKEAEKLLTPVYERMIKFALHGGDFEEQPKAITQVRDVEWTPELEKQADDGLAKAKELVGGA